MTARAICGDCTTSLARRARIAVSRPGVWRAQFCEQCWVKRMRSACGNLHMALAGAEGGALALQDIARQRRDARKAKAP